MAWAPDMRPSSVSLLLAQRRRSCAAPARKRSSALPFKVRVGWGWCFSHSLTARSAELPLALRASGLLLALPKSRQKARRLTRCPAARHARRGVPALLGAGGVVWQYIPVLSADARASCARPCGHFPPSPAMLGTANGAGIHEAVHPCTASRNSSGELLLLRQDAAQTGPPVARRGCAGKVRRRAHTMCARSLNVQGRTSSEPRSTLAESEGRMPGDRATGGVFLWLSFFAQAKKVTRSPVGRVEALQLPEQTKNMIKVDSGLTRAILALALRASFAVRARSGARSHRNDERKNSGRGCRD